MMSELWFLATNLLLLVNILCEYPTMPNKVTKQNGFFLQKLVIKGEIIHQWTVQELWFLHPTHRLLLDNMSVQLFEYPLMHNKVTERKDIFFRN